VRLGLTVGYWGLGLDQREQAEQVIAAERHGYDSAWVAEAFGSDAATVLGWLAAQTSTIALGSCIFQMPGRTAAMTAMTAATLDGLADGRFRLGLGPSGVRVAEGFHGVPFTPQLTRTRDYLSVVRLALAGRRLRHPGEALAIPRPGFEGVPLRLSIRPRQRRLPIYLAAMGPRATALAGELADGWIPFLFAPEAAPRSFAALAEGCERAGRTLAEIDVAPVVGVCIDELGAAREMLRPLLALYLGGMGSARHNFYNAWARENGFAEAAAVVQEHYLAGRRAAAAAALPDELVDAVTLCGPAGRVRRRLDAYRSAGVDTLIVWPVGRTPEDRLGQIGAVAELTREAEAIEQVGDPSVVRR
jgi:F420-dependent oxidoreductase-like protein